MAFVSLPRRGLVLAVALHLAALPVAASLHAASHYRYESGVALDHDAEPCPESAGPHRAHLEQARDPARDLLCEFCQLFQQGLHSQACSSAFHADMSSGQADPGFAAESAHLPSCRCALPRSRAPPVLA